MCPKEAKIFLAEDNEDWRTFDRQAVTEAGHQVVIEVDEVEKGLKAVIGARDLGINVALLDGRIPFDSSDGTTLAVALREAIPNIKVVDISAFGDAVKGADARMAKLGFKSDRLGKLVTDL